MFVYAHGYMYDNVYVHACIRVSTVSMYIWPIEFVQKKTEGLPIYLKGNNMHCVMSTGFV